MTGIKEDEFHVMVEKAMTSTEWKNPSKRCDKRKIYAMHDGTK